MLHLGLGCSCIWKWTYKIDLFEMNNLFRIRIDSNSGKTNEINKNNKKLNIRKYVLKNLLCIFQCFNLSAISINQRLWFIVYQPILKYYTAVLDIQANLDSVVQNWGMNIFVRAVPISSRHNSWIWTDKRIAKENAGVTFNYFW